MDKILFDKAIFSKRLADRRKACGYETQTAFAKAFNERFRNGENLGGNNPTKGIYGTIKNYENPKNSGSPSLDRVLEMCSLLDCDIEYLLGGIQCKTKDNQFIHDETGLSEYAINQLKQFHNDTLRNGQAILKLINWLMQDPRFTYQLTDRMIKYSIKFLEFEKGKKKYAEEQRHLREMAQGDEIKELQLLMNGNFPSTISATDLSSLSDLKDIAHLQAQRALDNVLDCLVYHHCKENGCDINGTY